MKKLLLALAAVALVMAVAVSCGNKKEKKAEGAETEAVAEAPADADAPVSGDVNMAKAVGLVNKMIAAVKGENIPAYCDAMWEFQQFGESLPEEEAERISDSLDDQFGDEMEGLIEGFQEEHFSEIIQYMIDNNMVPDMEDEEGDFDL